MAEALGVASSIVALLETAHRVVEYLKAVKDAPKDVNRLTTELRHLVNVLQALQTANITPTVRSLLDSPLYQCIQELDGLRAELPLRSGIKGAIDRLKWPLKEGEIQKQIDQFERFKGLFTLALVVDNVDLMRRFEPQIADMLYTVQTLRREQEVRQEDEVSRRADKKRDKILQWFSPNKFDGKHREICNRRAEGTGKWIEKAPELQQWIGGEHNGQVLWGKAAPGAGKTFLCSVIIDHLQGVARTKNYGMAYFYFDYNNQDLQELEGVLASLAMQLMKQTSHLPRDVEALYDELKQTGTRPTVEQLETVTLSSSKMSSRVFLIFDALDEYAEESRETFLLSLERMKNQGINILVISRPHLEDLNEALVDAAELNLSARREDLEIFIHNTISTRKRAKHLFQDPVCRAKVVSVLTQCANGMFQLVYLLLDELCVQIRVNDMLNALDEMEHSAVHRTYDAIYDKTIQRLHDQPPPATELALKILVWLAKAKRALTVDELRAAVSVKPNLYTLSENDLPPRSSLVDVCGGLVTIDETNHTVRLVHSTVQEYILGKPDLLPQDGDFLILEACTTYLSLDVFKQGPCITWDEWKARLRLHPLLTYAAKYWQFLISSCSEDLSTNTICEFLKHPGSISSYAQSQLWGGNAKAGLYQTGLGPLHVACTVGHGTVVQLLIQEGNNLEAKDTIGRTPLHFAVLAQNGAIVRILLENDAVVAVPDKRGETPPHRAASGGSWWIVRRLLQKGAPVSVQNRRGETPLHNAVRAGNQKIVQALLQNGADVSMPDRHGVTPLHEAASAQNEVILQMLVEKGADISVQAGGGETPLHYAASARNEAMVRMLLDVGAEVSVQAENGETPLHTAALSQNEATVTILLESGAAASAQKMDGVTPLHLAAHAGNEAIVRRLLKKGAAYSMQDKLGETPLHKAASGGNPSIVRLLLQKGTPVSVQNRHGDTALHYAAAQNHAIVLMLLESGADVSVQNRLGETPLYNAARALTGNEAIIQALLDHGTDVSVQNKMGDTPLHEAAYRDNGAIVRMLLDKGADVSVNNRAGETPLYNAARALAGNDVILQALLERGADVSVRAGDGGTPLHSAVQAGDQGAVTVFVDKGADVSVRDNHGVTPLHYAAPHNETMVRMLLEMGADVSVRDNEGRTPLDIATSAGNDAITRLLLKQPSADVDVSFQYSENIFDDSDDGERTDESVSTDCDQEDKEYSS